MGINLDGIEIKFDRDKIRQLVLQEGVTYTQFARKIGTSRQRVKNWLDGESTPNTEGIEAICNAYGVRPNYFFVKNLVRELDIQDREGGHEGLAETSGGG